MIQQRDTVRAASEFASRNQLPPNIQDQMLSHICLKFKTEGLKQQETLNGLPKAIRSSIANYLFLHILQKVYLFEGVSRNFLFQLVKHSFVNSLSFLNLLSHKVTNSVYLFPTKVSDIDAEYFPPREDVILQNEAPTDLYILVSGAVVSSFILKHKEKFKLPSNIFYSLSLSRGDYAGFYCLHWRWKSGTWTKYLTKKNLFMIK